MSSRRLLANAIRVLSVDAVEKANSGHPGAPMGMADIAEVLWNDFLNHNPQNPSWPNRDRFVLSNGHASMLLYSLLHLTGYDVSLTDLQQFRQLHSKTPGHPEYGHTPGVETTTGPLGQGFANAVGMALAERTLAATFNRPGLPVIDHFTYVFAGDGCLMEGISHEAAEFAAVQGLGKLIVVWDDNEISIDGDVAGWSQTDVVARFKSYGWHVIPNINGHHAEEIKQALAAAKAYTTAPSFIACKTKIACGAPNLCGSHKAHGAALGATEVAATRAALQWPSNPFEIPDEIYRMWDAREKGGALEQTWQQLFAKYQQQYPELALELTRRLQGDLPVNWSTQINNLLVGTNQKAENLATRKASQKVLNHLGTFLPELLGGSADLTESNGTWWTAAQVANAQTPDGNYLHYGVREFAMSAIMNGIACHGGFIPFGGTFLVFCDYARNAVRMSALMKQRVIFIYSHDSVGLGEDGPTHQPIEHAWMLRMTPHLSVWRPCDATETLVAWQHALERKHGPSCLLLSRQNLVPQCHPAEQLPNIARGGYILRESSKSLEVILIATGSEVNLAMLAAQQLEVEYNIGVRVVSMPNTNVFDAQSREYQEQVLPPYLTLRVAIEAGHPDGWYKYVGLFGRVVGIARFGESAPGEQAFKALGITTAAVVAAVQSILN